MPGLRFSFSPLDWGCSLAAEYSHTLRTPSLIPKTTQKQTSWVSYSSYCAGCCCLWAEGKAGQGSAAVFSFRSFPSLVWAAAAGCKELFSLWPRQVPTHSIDLSLCAPSGSKHPSLRVSPKCVGEWGEQIEDWVLH
jgi:hypothetical protein